ncbi:hypothetical protein N7457_004183 [Penicillium paradoxum]|uniref:uncharacterized protein n=1 Tax=Penicillium paradoxum TaxID=176176 RepID=UPI002546A92F|nr:uncharacterized protein N7457_004183 [Penicillium paradoxum]KAJ5782409.1 hypothetical protein N7457_004183 [Penicillium paradoxum]
MKGKLMFFDEVAWDRCDDQLANWKASLFNQQAMRKITDLIIHHQNVPAAKLFPPQKGAFNMVIRLQFTDHSSSIIRFPIPGYSVFPEEKVQREVSVMTFLSQHSTIRIPRILHHGMTDDSPQCLGPFIIMEHIDNNADLVDALITPGLPDEDRPVLDPNISVHRLRSVYSEMAGLLLQVAKHTFPRIGCISFQEKWDVRHRPLSINMNELVQVGGVQPEDLPQTPFDSGTEYFLALAELHMTHLSSQRNDAIEDAEDCRMKYIARCLFRRLAREGRLCRYPDGPFRLFCDDLRPANVLADSNCGYGIVGVIDWEFAYAAPAEFVYSPPCWLLLERPEYWEQGLDDWERAYEVRLEVFLQEMRVREEEEVRKGIIREEDQLSGYMRESWDSGGFWVSYAARRSWAFDIIYWERIDRRFFGEGELEDRVALLSVEEREGMEAFVRRKLEEKEEGGLKSRSGSPVTVG